MINNGKVHVEEVGGAIPEGLWLHLEGTHSSPAHGAPWEEKAEGRRDTGAAGCAGAAAGAWLWGLGAATAWAATATPELGSLHLHNCQAFPS